MKLCCKLNTQHFSLSQKLMPHVSVLNILCSWLTLICASVLLPPDQFTACCGKFAPHFRHGDDSHDNGFSHSDMIPWDSLGFCSCVYFCVCRVQVRFSGPGIHCGQLREYRFLKLCSCQRLYHHSHRQTDQRPASQGDFFLWIYLCFRQWLCCISYHILWFVLSFHNDAK